MFYKGIIFDLDNTIYDYNLCHNTAINEVFDYLIQNNNSLNIEYIKRVYEDISIKLKFELTNILSKIIIIKNLNTFLGYIIFGLLYF